MTLRIERDFIGNTLQKRRNNPHSDLHTALRGGFLLPKKIIYTADIQMTKKYISLMLTSIYIIDILSPSNQGKLHETLRSTIRREAGPWRTKARLVEQGSTAQ